MNVTSLVPETSKVRVPVGSAVANVSTLGPVASARTVPSAAKIRSLRLEVTLTLPFGAKVRVDDASPSPTLRANVFTGRFLDSAPLNVVVVVVGSDGGGGVEVVLVGAGGCEVDVLVGLGVGLAVGLGLAEGDGDGDGLGDGSTGGGGSVVGGTVVPPTAR